MYGNFSEMEENTWVGKKYIHVNSGGVFEIHGKKKFGFKIEPLKINLQAPVAQKIAHEVVFRRFQGEGVEF